MGLHTRENNFDVLRIVSMVSVVFLHVSCQFITPVVDNARQHVLEEVLFFNVFSRMAVPCFIMLSGAFLLCKETLDVRQFYSKTYRQLIKPTLFVSALCLAYVVLKSALLWYYGLLPMPFAEKMLTLLWNTVNGAPYYHLWYMYMLFGLYAITPVLLMLKRQLSQRQAVALAGLCLLAGLGQHHAGALFWMLDWAQYVGYFLCGALIREKAASIGLPKWLFLAVSLLLLLLALAVTYAYTLALHTGERNVLFTFIPSLASHAYDFFIVPNAELIVAASLCFFVFFAKLSVKKSYAQAAELTFFMYLVHAPIIDMLLTVQNMLAWRGLPILVSMLLLVVLTLACSYYAAKGLKRFLVTI